MQCSALGTWTYVSRTYTYPCVLKGKSSKQTNPERESVSSIVAEMGEVQVCPRRRPPRCIGRNLETRSNTHQEGMVRAVGEGLMQ